MGQYKSLIKAITDAIQTGVGGNVSLNEKTLLSHLLERRRGESIFPEVKFDGGPVERHETFIITRWLIRLICKLLTRILWLFNVGCYVVLLLFRGISLRQLHEKNWRNVKYSPIINLAAVVIVLVLGIVFLVNMITVGVKDIMFASVNMRVNSQGVITLEQPGLESHSFFLMNASTFWWPTDITVSKRDRVTISVSGSMYSDIGEICSAANSNRHLRYSRSFFAEKNKKESLFDGIGTSICIEPNACFGALLCRISNEHQGPSKLSKDQIEVIEHGKNRFKAKQFGVLYITFNDVFLTKETVEKLRDSAGLSTIVLKEDLEETGYFSKFNSGQLETADEEIWFNDNVGEYLVNIRVRKNICHSNIQWYKKPIFIIYRGIDRAKWWIVGAILLYIILDVWGASYLLQKWRRVKCHTKISEKASE